MPQYRGRYAPSPTGRLHLGNLRTALLSWLHCRLQKGHFTLRIDDLDLPRNKPGAVEQILHDLSFIGIDWDALEIQSQRLDVYQYYFSKLQTNGRIFACRCSRKDIASAMSAPHGTFDSNLIYPGTCRNKNIVAVANEDIAYRFIVANHDICFVDEIHSRVCQNLTKAVGDFVIKRRDQLFAYQFASAIDDMQMAITHIVRGADLLDSSFRQLAIMHALEARPPTFCHVPLLVDANGARLSKRDGSVSLQQLADKSAAHIIAMLIKPLGLVPHTTHAISASQLLAQLQYDDFIAQLKRLSNA